MLRNHNLMDVSQGNQANNQQPSLLEVPIERCRIHKSKVVDMYCEHHDAVGCSTCFVKDHKSCPDSHIHSIPDMIDSLFNLPDYKQTYSLLKDNVVAMETVSKSKEAQLQTLKKTKNEELDKIDVFQKALEAVVRKISEASRKEVEAAYEERETEILQDKHIVESIRNELQTTDDKLEQSEENRAQRFVCTKLAQESLTEAENEKLKEELHNGADLRIIFTPDQSLLEYIKASQGIGQLRIPKRNWDIMIKLPRETGTCSGCCLIDFRHLLVTDKNNKKLKRIDVQKMSVVDYCALDSIPYGVCCISKLEVAVACMKENKIQFVSIGNKMTPTRQMKMSHCCHGIAFKEDKLFVTDWNRSLLVYDMTGICLKTISQDNVGNLFFTSTKHVTFNDSGNKMFVGNGNNGLVCFDGMSNYLYTINDKDLKCVVGVCFGGGDNIFVTGYSSDNVVQFDENGKKCRIVATQADGLTNPCSVCFHQKLNRMFVTMEDSDVVKMY